jgi:transcriptional regulator with XRE-family HTH domain
MTGDDLRRLRQAKGWSQSRMASALGFTCKNAKSIISSMEAGVRRISPRDAFMIRALLASEPEENGHAGELPEKRTQERTN